MQSGQVGPQRVQTNYTVGPNPKPITRENIEQANRQLSTSSGGSGGPREPGVMKKDGITYRVDRGDVAERTADSGVKAQHSEEAHVFTLPGGERIEVGLKQGLKGTNYDESNLSSSEGNVTDLKMVKNEDGLDLISFRDQEGNSVNLEPDSLTYEVMNKAQNLSQVFHPDGYQEVVAFGTFRDENGQTKPFENRALYSPEGELERTRGFEGLEVDKGRIRFKMENGEVASRSLAKPLPGQVSVERPSQEPAASAQEASNKPLTLDVTGPLLLGGGLPPLDGPNSGTQVAENVGDDKPLGPSLLELANQELAAKGEAPIVKSGDPKPEQELVEAPSSLNFDGPEKSEATHSTQVPSESPGLTQAQGQGSLEVGVPVGTKKETAEVETSGGSTVSADSSVIDRPTTGARSESDATPEVESRPFAHLTDLSQDFYAAVDSPEVAVHELPNGLAVREEGETRAFRMPNGDSFRTDGQQVEVLGEQPTARNARIATEGEQQFLAYSDPKGNRYKVDVNSGDWEVSNRQGTLTQGFNSDGSKEFGVRGTYTTEAGTPQQYFFKAKFGADGQPQSNEGFKDLAISKDVLSFTLPNGEETGRTLIERSGQSLKIDSSTASSEPKTGGSGLSLGVDDEWGGALDFANNLYGTQAVKAGGESSPSSSLQGAGAQGSSEPIPTPSGLLRKPIAGGGMETQLPNGITLFDFPGSDQNGDIPQAYAQDAEGNKLEVVRTPYQTEGGEAANLLSFQGVDGVGYMLSDGHLDMIVSSPDAKVNQMVRAKGTILTAIQDGPYSFLHEMDTVQGWQMGSPGVGLDPHHPGMVFAQGSPQGSYAMPWNPNPAVPINPQGATSTPTGTSGDPFAEVGSLGSAPDSGQPSVHARPGQPQEGFQPSFWQRLKGAFTGENPWAQQGVEGPQPGGDPRMQGHQAHHAPPPHMGGYPGGHYTVGPDPYLEEMRQMNRATNIMMIGSMAASFIPTLFYGSYFMY